MVSMSRLPAMVDTKVGPVIADHQRWSIPATSGRQTPFANSVVNSAKVVFGSDDEPLRVQ